MDLEYPEKTITFVLDYRQYCFLLEALMDMSEEADIALYEKAEVRDIAGIVQKAWDAVDGQP